MKKSALVFALVFFVSMPDINGYFWYSVAGDFVYWNLSDCNGYMPWDGGYGQECDGYYYQAQDDGQ